MKGKEIKVNLSRWNGVAICQPMACGKYWPVEFVGKMGKIPFTDESIASNAMMMKREAVNALRAAGN